MDGHEIGIEFCGEWFHPARDEEYTIGRDADLVVDENPYLHRRLLSLGFEGGMWWLANVGQSISVSLSTADGVYQAVLGPGARVPLVFPRLVVLFTAGPYTYELSVHSPQAAFHSAPLVADASDPTQITIGNVSLTPTQRLLVIALCEPMLRDGIVGQSQIPSSAQAAARLGWPLTTFNRKLDAVCDKLDREGVTGLRGGAGRLATNRRARLVEHAILSRLVTPQDLGALDEAVAAARA
ncbi:hypothetical protein N3K63_10125 [Microbacterium sp. W1N]|uniref:hypothetical protein n=1 Tax=Microbacterium festucae TaxID=2977531 RepID=UPI0021BE627A|nr:hypothetical protein [Microbacterium festucae]MCT9820637.1 hypothetical protein [Microbacterium festucae]